MCTVTFIPVVDRVFLTSNRDEKRLRPAALPPRHYPSESGALLYPTDAAAGGTWAALHEQGHVAILLNGAFIAHAPEPPYKKSRGLVLLDIVSSSFPADYFSHADLSGIEPFTVIIWSAGILYECRWDGNRKHTRLPDPEKAHIWSSVTLYDPAITHKRERWFSDWCRSHPSPDMEDIFHFHNHTGDGDKHNDLRMNREGQVLTVSITAMELTSDTGIMHYMDLALSDRYKAILPFRQTTADLR